MHTSTTRFIEIATRIEESIRSDPAYALPTVMEVASRHGIAYATAWKVFRELKRRGVVSSAPGKKLLVSCAIRPDAGTAAVTAAEVLALELEQRIGDGTFPVGSQLPKVSYFEATQHHARCTVLRAMRLLASRNLIRKERNRWIAGPARLAGSRSSGGDPQRPVVVVNIKSSSDWFELFENHFSSAFMTPFSQELVNHRVLLKPSVRTLSERRGSMDVMIGIDETRAAVKKLGVRYAGSIVWSVDPYKERIGEWITSLAGLGKPVVYVDSTGIGNLTRSEVRLGREYIRMHLDEGKLIRTALEHLAAAGHRTIGVHNWRETDWAVRRIGQIQTITQKSFPALRVVIGAPAEPQWHIADWAGTDDFVRTVAAQEGVSYPEPEGETAEGTSLRSAVAAFSRSLLSLFADHGATAILALSDRLAREYLAWARILGIAIPRELSLVSVDNMPESVFFPVSTIDPGLGRLGYLGAHVFIGDIGVRADRFGSIPGRCTMVDRGSVAAPSARRLGETLRRIRNP